MAHTSLPFNASHDSRLHVPEGQSEKITRENALNTLEEAKEKVEEILKRRIYVNEALIDGYETLIPAVGALLLEYESCGADADVPSYHVQSIFVASVQGQIVASSQTLDLNTIQIAANWFAFNGLVLDILGTAFGSMRLLSLQRSSRGAERHQEHIKNVYEIFQNAIHSKKSRLHPNDALNEDLKQALGKFEDMAHHIQSLYESAFPSLLDLTPVFFIPLRVVIRWTMTKSTLIQNVIKNILKLDKFFLPPKRRRPRSTIPDQVPIVVMAVGIIFLLISVILRAASTQSRRVWLGCIIITGIVCLYASPGITHTDRGHQKCQEKKMKEDMETFEVHFGIKTDEKLTN